jgi:UDP-GlcNAc:undecaprenyl-phosphate GlcNAc-1-phosphate transferase
MQLFTLLSLPITLAIALVLVPIFTHYAPILGLLDKPNSRKVHNKPIPVIGGLAIGSSLLISLIINPQFIYNAKPYIVLLSAAYLLMVVGIFDDKLNLKASHRLIIQLISAFAVAASGIRLTSLYGIFGVNELTPYISYSLTILLIAGVVNAFNLIDGIDGLAGLLALVGFSVLSYLAFINQKMIVLIILLSLIGAIIGFLVYNLNAKKKIFLGDGGSLLLGFLMVTAGIHLLESNPQNFLTNGSQIAIVFGVFLIPVLDSLRVYYSRMKRGFSPFEADKTHLHHLFLHFNISHKKTSTIIAGASIVFLFLLGIVVKFYGLNAAIIVVSALFLAISALMALIKDFNEWKTKITHLEQE